jgi:hypothetical protein
MSKDTVCGSCGGTGADNVSGFAGACDVCEGTGVVRRKRFWKTTLVFEILTEGESALPDDMSVVDMLNWCIVGEASGDTKSLESIEVDAPTMAKLLEDQRSDPTFLLGDDVCTACWGTGQMSGAICAHCEEEE